MAIKGILFDKDGTLVDFHATWYVIGERLALQAADGDTGAADDLMKRSGFDFEAGRFRADSVFAAGTNAGIVDAWFPDAAADERREWVRHFDEVTAREGAAQAVPFDGLKAALETLRDRGLRLGLATNDSTTGAEQTLIALGLAQMFSAAFGYDAVANPKPAPDVLHAFADMAGLKPGEIAMVGDNGHDIETGRAAGAGLTVGVLSGTGTRETLARADVILNSVIDLPDCLAGR